MGTSRTSACICEEPLPVEHPRHLGRHGARGALQDLVQLLAVGEGHVELEEEAIELRLRAAGRCPRSPAGSAWRGRRTARRARRSCLATVTRCSCIASSSALCVFGVARLISSASTMLAKMRPLAEAERLLPARALVDDRGADDVGRHHVGRELDARELQLQRLGHGAHQHGLAEAGHALEQRVRAGEHAGEHPVDDIAVAHDHLAHLLAELADALLELDDLGARGLFALVRHDPLSSGPLGLHRAHSRWAG